MCTCVPEEKKEDLETTYGYLLGNTENKVIIALNMKTKSAQVQKAPEAFEFFSQSTYLKLSKNKCLCIGGYKDNTATDKIQ